MESQKHWKPKKIGEVGLRETHLRMYFGELSSSWWSFHQPARHPYQPQLSSTRSNPQPVNSQVWLNSFRHWRPKHRKMLYQERKSSFHISFLGTYNRDRVVHTVHIILVISSKLIWRRVVFRLRSVDGSSHTASCEISLSNQSHKNTFVSHNTSH